MRLAFLLAIVCRSQAPSVVDGIEFEIEKGTIKQRSLPTLDTLAGILGVLDCERVEIRGHLGAPQAYPMDRRLSQLRADAVMAAMIQRGIDPMTLEAHGFEDEGPLVPHSDPNARKINGRIELVLVRCPLHP